MTGLIITDSLGLPRCEIERGETWLYQFIADSKDINYTYLRRGGTTNYLKDVMVHYDYLSPDYIIVQLGICDCTRRVKPRILLGMRRCFKGGDLLNKVIYKFVGWYMFCFTKIIKIHDVNSEKYRKNILEFIDFYKKKNSNVKIYICAIAGAGEKLVKKVYGIEQDICYYNQILEEISLESENVFFVNPYLGKEAKDYVLESDGHHLNKNGNELFYNKIKEVFRRESDVCV